MTLLSAVLVFFFASFAHGQEQQFVFDANGNLTVQTTEISAPPQILSQPQDQVVAPGALASYFVVLADTRQLTYQWRFNGTDISGATGDALLLQNVGAADEGQYSVVLVNSSGSATSAPAALLLDGDRDGLPDSWEQTYFGGLSQKPTGDFDGDGVSNLDEWLDGTNPADSASILFRLTVISDGGQVTVNPRRFSFTNGEIVTLTATAFPPNTVHGWTGDTNTTSPTISLVMTTNTTVFAHLGTYDITWASISSGDWNVASNWQPNVVPGTNDNVFISKGVTVTLNSNAECGSLMFGGMGISPTLTGSGTLSLHRDSFWTGGTMRGSGRTIIPAGVTLTVNNPSTVFLTTRTLENGGTVLWTGANIGMASAVITNRAGALFQAQNSASPALQSGVSRFDNAGTFRKSLSAGTTTIASSISLNNYNAVDIQSGTLLLLGGGLNHGVIDVPAGAKLELSGGTFTARLGSSISGAGNFTVSGATANLAGLVNLAGAHLVSSGTANLTGNYICTNNTLTISGGTANFSGRGTVTPATINLSNGTLTGNNVVRALNQMNWTGGTMSGRGRTLIPAGVTLTVNNPSTVFLTTRTLENGGTVLWTGANIGMAGAVITNRAGALFQAQNSASLALQSGVSRFDNAGTFRKSVSSGTMSMGSNISLNNYNTVEIQTGILAANGGYTSTSSAELNCALGGTAVGTGYGRLQAAGSVALNGSLTVDLANGFLPATNDTFTVLTAGTRNGAFANFYYPSNEVAMVLGNTVNSVIVRVTGTAASQPILLSPELAGSDVRLTWTAISNATYRLEYKTDLISTNWSDLAGDVTSVSNSASKLDVLTPSNRFYRVRVLQ